MNILFTAVGNSDPIANYTDGPIVNILRFNDIDIVYLYLSNYKTIESKQDLNTPKNNTGFDRNHYAIDQVSKIKGKNIKVINIINDTIDEPHLFDPILERFDQELDNINSLHPDADNIYLNLSSGTTAMKSALLTLAVINKSEKLQGIQVAAPEDNINRENTRDNDDSDFVTQWELFIEDDSQIDRSTILTNYNYHRLLEEENIKLLINNYDYEGALKIVSNSTVKYDEQFASLLEAAKHRYTLNADQLSKLNKKLEPKNRIHTKSIASEFTILLDLKYKKNEITDYLRALSPLLVHLFYKVLADILKELKININDYIGIQNGNNIDRNTEMIWKETVRDDLFKNTLNQDNNFRFYSQYSNYVSSHQLSNLIVAFGKELEDSSLLKDVEDVRYLRDVESKLRNKVAHQMVAFDDNEVKDETGFTFKDIHNKLKRLAINTNVINNSDFDNYDDMNEILNKLI